MPEFDLKYIEDHSTDIHTYDSYGRGLIELIFRTAIEQNKGKPTLTNPLELKDVKVFITPVGATGCIRVCVDTPFGRLCYHVKV